MRALGDEEVTCFDIVHKFALFTGKKRGRNWGSKGSKHAHLPINHSISVINGGNCKKWSRRDVEGTCFGIFQLLPVFWGDKGEIGGQKRVKTCPSPNKCQYKCY